MLWAEAATATVQVPDWCYATAVPLLCASEVCCAVVVPRWAAALIVLVYARGTYALSKCTNACTEKKSIRDPNLLHERQ